MSLDEMRPFAGDDERTEGFFARVHHDYSSFTPGCNWRDFCLVHLGGEWSTMTGRVELDLCLLGVHLNLTYVYDDTFSRTLLGRRDEILENWRTASNKAAGGE